MKTPNRILIGISLFMLCLVKPSIAQTEITFYTSEGDFVVEMYDTLQPITAGNIIKLVNEEYFDGIIFHRVIDNFVIQGGDPTGTGSGGPGYSIQDEFHPSLSNIQKTLSMANSGPNTGGSQFFVNLVNNTFLDYNKPPLTSKHPVFGIVKTGFDIVQNIGKVSVDANDRPIVDVVMDSVRVTLNPFVGIKQAKENINLAVYPNPILENSLLSFQSVANKQINVTILNSQGKMISSFDYSAQRGKNVLNIGQELWGSDYVNGIYYIVLNQEGSTTSRKLILMK